MVRPAQVAPARVDGAADTTNRPTDRNDAATVMEVPLTDMLDLSDLPNVTHLP